jgi:hypothetical protein
LPERYAEGQDAHFEVVAKLLQRKLGVQAKQVIDYWEGADCVCLAYTVQTGIFFDTHLLILDMQGNTLLHQPLQQQGKGIGTEAFVWAGGYLCYVEEKGRLWQIQARAEQG